MSLTQAVMDSVTVVAQQITVDPITPPGSQGILRILGWGRWIGLVIGIAAVLYAAGKFGWERWSHGSVESPKILAAAAIGGVIASVAPQIIYATQTGS